MLLLGLGLLTACGPDVPTPKPETEITRDTIPAVPRVVNDTFNCAVSDDPISGNLPSNPRDTGNVISRLQPQASEPESVWTLLYASKYLLNTFYFGYSTTDLNALHQSAYQNFKKTYPNALSTYAITAQVDPLMNEYVAPIEVQDEHTYYLNAQDIAYLKAILSNAPTPTPVFGLSYATVPGGDGVVITDVRDGGPAMTNGLRRGDVLLSVNGQLLKRTVQPSGTDDRQQRQIYAKIIADAAALKKAVTFDVRRGSTPRQINLTGTDQLSAAAQPWSETVWDASGQPYMYLRLPTFESAGTGATVHRLVAQANANGMKGIIVDLRNNGGGLLTEYVSAAAAFVPTLAGETVKFVDGSTSTFKYTSGAVLEESSCKNPTTALPVPNPNTWNGKVAVLINGGSASGSEMFSANVRQGGKARLIGEETYGVGNTSTFLFRLPGELGLSVTAGRVFINGQQATPTVQPDTNIPDDMAALAATGVDKALQTALTELAK